MLRPHPAVLSRLVEEYEALAAVEAVGGAAEPASRARDLEYTLCVSTGTRDVKDALETAHRWLASATAPETTTARKTLPVGEPVPARSASPLSRPLPLRRTPPLREPAVLAE
ncbi:DUF5133 domain-containing protein [Streptomyces sp. NPDC052701]|uniref:DUF5133 domain-containing protein n=1 Tax=Streptomyces sp. NPDC052701 TaxID=3155533 RepID=UPI0034462606